MIIYGEFPARPVRRACGKKTIKNKHMKLNHLIVAALTSYSVSSAIAQDKCMITIKADKPTAAIQPTMWGVFFEDINMGADGGIYSELIKNR